MDRRISVDLFKKGDFLRRSSQHNDQKSHYDHYLDTDRLLNETKRFVNELRDGNDKMLASKKRSELEARVCNIAVADMTFIFAERTIYTFDQNRTNLRRPATRADNEMCQIDLLKCTAFIAYQTFYWLHRDFNAQKKETLIYFLANKGLRLPPHLELELHTDIIALRRRAQRDPWTYISETRKRKEPLISNWIKLKDPHTDEKTGSKTTEIKLSVPPVILLNETKPPENIAENHLNERGSGRHPLDVTMGGKEPTNAIPGPGKSLKAKDHSLKTTMSLEKSLNEAKALEDPPKSKEKRKRTIMGVKHLKGMTGSGMEKESSATNEHLAPEDPPKSKGQRKTIAMGVKHFKMMVESKVQKEYTEANEHLSKEAGKMDKEEKNSLETDDLANEELPNERMTEKKKEMPLKADDEANKNPPKVETVRKDKEDSETQSLKRDDKLDETGTLENPSKTVEKRKRIVMGIKHLKTTMESKVEKESTEINQHLIKDGERIDEKETKTFEIDDVANEELPNERPIGNEKKMRLNTDDGTNENPLKVETVMKDEEDSESLKTNGELNETDALENAPKTVGTRKMIIMGVKHLREINRSRLEKEPSATYEHLSKEAVRKDKEEKKSLVTDVANGNIPQEKPTQNEEKTLSLKADDEAKEHAPEVESARKDNEDRESMSLKIYDEINETDSPKKIEKRKRIIMGVNHLKLIMESRIGKEPCTANERVSKEALRKDEKEKKSLETDDVTVENPSLSKEKRQTTIMGVKQLEEMVGRRMEKESSEANGNEQTESNGRAKENSTTSTDVKKEKLLRERPHIQTKVKLRWRKKNKNKGENIPKGKKTKKHPIRSAIRNFCVSVFERLVAAFR